MLSKSSVDQFLVRELNLSSVLRMIQSEAPLSRAQLAAKNGLNKSTISNLVDDLLERRLIHETGINSVGTCRPATQLEINSKVGAVEAGGAMGIGLAGLVNIFNPEKIILGGPISVAGEYLLPSIRQSVNKHAMRETVN